MSNGLHGTVQVFEWLMCSEPKLDSHRFMDILEEAIKEGSATRHARFTKWAKQVAAKPRPKNPLAKGKKRKKDSDREMALVAQIRCASLLKNPGACAHVYVNTSCHDKCSWLPRWCASQPYSGELHTMRRGEPLSRCRFADISVTPGDLGSCPSQTVLIANAARWFPSSLRLAETMEGCLPLL
jgi:hypothetical protein